MLVSDIKVGDVLTFDVHAHQLLGNRESFTQVKVLGILSGSIATTMGYDVAALHANIYSVLDSSTVTNDYNSYDYLLISNRNGSRSVIGLPWIREETIDTDGDRSLILEFHGITEAQVQGMLTALSAHGFKPDEIKKF